MTTIALSWPPKELSPNARVHWGRKSRATKSYRSEAAVATMAAVPGYRPAPGAELGLIVTFYAPDNRSRDRDNLIASMKAAQDGIAQALRIDDSLFRPRYQFGEPVNGGAVMVTIGGDA